VIHLTSAIHAEPNEFARAAAIDFARRLAAHWRTTLGSELLGAYLIGSVAHAGFSWRYSDVSSAPQMCTAAAAASRPKLH
jgi:hypothetical protein